MSERDLDMEQERGSGSSESDQARLEAAYAHALQVARDHYENFPVASRLLPRSIRRHVAAIYLFARRADDYADEGESPVEERLIALDRHEERLDRALDGRAEDPLFVALGETLRRSRVDDADLRRLLDAFRQDARNRGFENREDLLDYCSRSANPIGRMMLALHEVDDPEAVAASDEVCTGLQLVNFWQDISRDLPRDRVNLPRSVMREFGVDRAQLEAGFEDEAFAAMIAQLVEEAEGYLQRGSRLLGLVRPSGFRRQLKWTIVGGLAVAEKIRRLDYRTLHRRPSLSAADLFLFMRIARSL